MYVLVLRNRDTPRIGPYSCTDGANFIELLKLKICLKAVDTFGNYSK